MPVSYNRGWSPLGTSDRVLQGLQPERSLIEFAEVVYVRYRDDPATALAYYFTSDWVVLLRQVFTEREVGGHTARTSVGSLVSHQLRYVRLRMQDAVRAAS